MTAQTTSARPAASNVAQQVRDTLILNESVIVECVNEVTSSMPSHIAELMRRALKASPSFAASIKRTTVDLGVVLSLAKSFDSDDAFGESAGLIHDIDFLAHDGKVAAFAKAMIKVDLDNLAKADAGELTDDAIIFSMLPTDVLRRRLLLLSAFIDSAMKQAA